LRDLKSKISSQSKKNFVLEKDVRYLDSRIALLIQNRMALEEVWTRSILWDIVLTCHSKTRLQAILKMRRMSKKGSSPMMRRHKNTGICSFSYSPNPDILHISAALSQWPRLTLCCRPSCSPYMGTNMKAGKSIYCSLCFR
jgi:hypothetical protein